MTLTQLSATTGISVSTLSRLESGQRKPTLELLLPLVRIHSVSLDKLVETAEPLRRQVAPGPFTRNGMMFVPLSRKSGALQAFKQILPGRTDASDFKQRVHDGYGWLYVLSVSLRLVLGGHDLILAPGEAAEFDTRVPHVYGSAGPEPAEILSVFGRDGDRIRVRAKTTKRVAVRRYSSPSK